MAGILFGDQRKNEQDAPRKSGGILFQDQRKAKEPYVPVRTPDTNWNQPGRTLSAMDTFGKIADELERTRPVLEKKKELPGRDIPVVGRVLKGLDKLADATLPFAQGAAAAQGVPLAESERLENRPITGMAGKIMYGAGALAGGSMNPAALEQSLITGPYKAAQGITNRLAPAASNVVRRGLTGAMAGAGAGGALSLISGQSDAKQVATNAALGAGVGAVGDVALGALGDLFGRLLKRNGVADDEVQEILSLPMGREDAARLRRANGLQTPDVITPDAPTLGLPSPKIEPPTTARIERRFNPYRQQFEDLMQKARERQEAGGMTPGREDMELEQMWASIAGREGGSLDDLIQRAYPTRREVKPDDLVKARNNQAWREVVDAPMPVKTLGDRYPQGGVQSSAAEPQTVPARAKGIKPNPETKVEPAPEPMTTVPKQEEVLNSSAADDVPDDIELPQPDEVAPRIRDRVSSYADDLINSAQSELSKNRNRLSSNPVDVYAQYAKLGAGYMLKGSVKLADFTETMVKQFGEEIRPHVREIFKRAKVEYQAINKKIEGEELGLSGFDAQELKDLSNINLNTADVYRNFRKVFGKDSPVIKAVLDPFDKGKASYAQEQKDMTDKLFTDIVKKLGIKRGSRESAMVQQYGEGKITIDELKSKTTRWKDVVKADQWFRQQYNELVDKVNESVKKIYPNNPDKLVPYRKDYYRHFQELTFISNLKNMFDSTSGRISPSLSGISPYTQPRTKWASFKQKRGLGEYKNDAVGGFLDYIPSAAYAIHIDPHISVFRNLAKRLASDTEQTANINNFIKFLNNFANDLSGKTSTFDRWVDDIGGRNGLRLMVQVNNRVKSNVILGNVRSTLSQLANIPNGIAYGGRDAPVGAAKTLQSIFQPNEAMAQSGFLKERYLDKSFRRFDQKWWEQPRRFAEAMMEISDRVGTSFVWNTAHAKGIREGVADPIKFADEQTRRLIGGRGIGEQPLLIKSKMFNIVAPFQLEVNNLWRVMKDFVDEKRFGSLATLFAANFLLNKAFEKTTGSGVVFDPIDAIYDAATQEDGSILTRGGRLAGEVMSNMPFGQSIASLYPEFGMNLFGYEMPTREGFFGEKDPTRFGSGLLAAGAISDPLFKFVLPFGGNQLKKSTQGIDALLRGGAYTENVLTTGLKNENPKLKYPVSSAPANALRSVLFSPNATTEGQDYNKNDRRPLSEKQTQQYLHSTDRVGYFNKLTETREINALKKQLTDVRNDNDLTDGQKQKKISELSSKLERLTQAK